MTSRQNPEEETMAVELPGAATDSAAGNGAGSHDRTSASGRERLEALLARYGVIFAFIAVIIVFSIARPHTFPTGANVKSILTSAAPSLVIAAGLTVVLVMGDFDLSFGAMIGLAAGAAIILLTKSGVGWPVAVLIALALGVAAGMANGYLIAYLGGPSFIITLAMGTVLTGVEFAITDQKTVFGGIPASYSNIGQHEILGLNNMIWIAAVVAIVLWAFLDRTEIGRF